MRGGICCGLGQLLVVPAGVGALTLTASAEWRGGGQEVEVGCVELVLDLQPG